MVDEARANPQQRVVDDDIAGDDPRAVAFAREAVAAAEAGTARSTVGAELVTFRRPGRRTVCITVPRRARTFDARTQLRVAVGVALGAVDRAGESRQPRLAPVITTTMSLSLRGML